LVSSNGKHVRISGHHECSGLRRHANRQSDACIHKSHIQTKADAAKLPRNTQSSVPLVTLHARLPVQVDSCCQDKLQSGPDFMLAAGEKHWSDYCTHRVGCV